jgi:NADH:ubiquinone oxidoreductase subunit F (NADH-binding)/NADH:ubiquinone oxidoreductase subunit E/NAD-dependent dihydropyrimidine dehydrogenase PreA subunit
MSDTPPNPSDLAATLWVDDLVKRVGTTPDKVIPILQGIQEYFHYLPEPLLQHVCQITEIAPADLTGVSTFYSQFRHRPAGLHAVKVCVGTACHVKGAGAVYDALARHLECKPGEDTDPQGLFTLEKVACLGCCTLAPVVQIDSVIYGHVTPATAPDILKKFIEEQNAGSSDKDQTQSGAHEFGEIRIGLGSCCVAGGSAAVYQAALDTVKSLGIPARVKSVGCAGMCHRTPLMEIVNAKGDVSNLYANITPSDVAAIIRNQFKPPSLEGRMKAWLQNHVSELFAPPTGLLSRPLFNLDLRDKPVANFLDRQIRIATDHYGRLDPVDLEEYLKHDGFVALKTCLTSVSPEEVVSRVTAAGLRGRGGAGFPTGIKWQRVRESNGTDVTIICNGDEGDPGAFMDRMLLESFPYRVIEGMLIAAYAVGAKQGIYYIRAEYPLALVRIREALARCRAKGLLGKNILGSAFSIDFEIKEGAGAFVCGEETALIRSIEGARGMPRLRPPYPAQKGLWGMPTLINNCETFASVPWILRNGPERFRAIGTAQSAGTKVFSLTGKIRHGGLIEVPMGMTLREIVEEVGGGIANNLSFKAVQIGGPSGGCIPAAHADLPVDFGALIGAGAMMGSGGLVVLDERDCMVDIARYFLTFTQSQSCGRCTFCRVGTRRMLDILDRICAGKGVAGDIERLEELAHSVANASLCGLGRTAPNPILSTIRYFRSEYEAHLQGSCPAGKCPDLIAYTITDRCIGCTLCAQTCPTDAIPFTPHERHVIHDADCVRCDMCRTGCPTGAIKIVTGAERKSLCQQ